MKIKIGTRGSRLALAQTALAVRALEARGYSCEIVTVSTRGDRDLTRPMRELGKDLFVDAFAPLLKSGAIDLAVHSCKDLPAGEEYDDFAALCRADVRDVLVFRRGAEISRIGTGSVRRQAELSRLYPQAEFLPVRGNLDTRLRKLLAAEYDALALAKAGLDRLGIKETEEFGLRVLSTEECLPAPCQGIIALQGEIGREIEDEKLTETALVERRLQRALGADCASGVGCLLEDGVLSACKGGKRASVSYQGEESVLRLAEVLR